MRYKAGLGLALLAVFLGLAAASGRDTQAGAGAALTDPLRTVRIEMIGLRADRVPTARAAVLSVPGVRDVQFIPGKREARVQFDVEQTSIRELERRIRKAGFTPCFH